MTPGLSVIIEAIKESRKIFQRMNSYAMYRIAETLRILLFMTLAILVFNSYPVTAVMIVMIALLNDGPFYRSPTTTLNTAISPKPGTCIWCWESPRPRRHRHGRHFWPVLSFVEGFSSRPCAYPDHDVPEDVRGRAPDDFSDPHARAFLVHTPAKILLIAVFGTQAVATLIAVLRRLHDALGWGTPGSYGLRAGVVLRE